METFKIYSNNKGFVMLEGALQEVKLVKVVFTLFEGEYTATTYFSTCNGGYSEKTNALKVYSSISDYEKGVEMNSKGVSENELFAIRPKGFSGIQFGYAFINGEPQRIDLTPCEIVYSYSNESYTILHDVTKEGNFYRTREECLSFNTYRVMNEFGDFKERIGAGKLLMLDDDQKQLLKNFEDAFKALRESGTAFFMTYDGLQVINKRNINFYEIDDDTFGHEKQEEVNIYKDVFNCKVLSECGDLTPIGDDFHLFVNRKD